MPAPGHARGAGRAGAGAIRLQRGPDTATLVVDPGEALEDSRHLTDYVMMACARVLRSAIGSDFPLREVHVRHAAWQDPAEPALPHIPPIPPTTSFQASVAEVTRALLSDGLRPDCATVACRLHLSDRTLQRRLDEERTTFKAVRDAVLWEVVDALLSNPSLKVEAVALSVGFGEVAAFSKAFKRQAGCSPTQYRERLAARARRRQRLRVVDGHASRDRSPR